jgi:hypothetical protein
VAGAVTTATVITGAKGIQLGLADRGKLVRLVRMSRTGEPGGLAASFSHGKLKLISVSNPDSFEWCFCIANWRLPILGKPVLGKPNADFR